MKENEKKLVISLNSESVDCFHDVLPAHRAFGELPTTLHTGQHVATVEEHAVHRRVHADLAQVVVLRFCGGKYIINHYIGQRQIKAHNNYYSFSSSAIDNFALTNNY